MAKSPLDRALDLFVYAPVGLALTAWDSLPELIDRGRGRVTGQVTAARLVGRMAVSQGQKEAGRVVTEATRRLADLGLVRDGRGSAAQPEAAPPSKTRGTVPAGAPEAEPASRPSAGELAIPGYDALSAPQVVQRLAGLSAEELEAVRAYESATRGRKTILSRIAQLQSSQR